MRQYRNPWYDSRNTLSPEFFEVSDEPIDSWEILDFYEVLSEHQRPSVLVVVNGERRDDKGHPDTVMGQYVTVAGALRAFQDKP